MHRPGHETRRRFAALMCGLALTCPAPAMLAEEPGEYRLKAAFLFHFAQYTEWPSSVGSTINLCIDGRDPFGTEVDTLQGKSVGTRSIAVQRRASGDALGGCQMVFITASAINTLPAVLETVRGRPVLTIADSPDAARRGVALNMTLAQDKIRFEANLVAARAAGLTLSSKLLRLATEVYQ